MQKRASCGKRGRAWPALEPAQPFRMTWICRKAMFLSAPYSLWRIVMEQLFLNVKRAIPAAVSLDTHSEMSTVPSLLLKLLYLSPPPFKFLKKFFFSFHFTDEEIEVWELTQVPPWGLGAGIQLQAWQLHHGLVLALRNMPYCLHKMIISKCQGSVLARNCNLIPLVISSLLGCVSLPAYFVNGEMGSQYQMHREAKNVM